MIITKTPFRLSFFGGGTDYNPWYEENGGLVVGCTFARYCYITVSRLPPFFDHKSRIVYSLIENVADNSQIKHPSVKACLQFLDLREGLEIHHYGELPARSGIGSSSSFTVGLLLALNTLLHRRLAKGELARDAIKVEQELIGESVGIQDQILAAHGGLRVIEMGPGRDYQVSPLELPAEFKAGLESHVMLGFTGLTRIASDIAQEQIGKIRAGENKSQLSEIHGIAKEALANFRGRPDLREIGSLLDRSWQLKRSMSPAISTDSVDAAFAKARRLGAYGGKLMGAGGGGFLFFLAPPEIQPRIKQELKDLIKVWVPFRFDEHGTQVLLHRNQPVEVF